MVSEPRNLSETAGCGAAEPGSGFNSAAFARDSRALPAQRIPNAKSPSSSIPSIPPRVQRVAPVLSDDGRSDADDATGAGSVRTVSSSERAESDGEGTRADAGGARSKSGAASLRILAICAWILDVRASRWDENSAQSQLASC